MGREIRYIKSGIFKLNVMIMFIKASQSILGHGSLKKLLHLLRNPYLPTINQT
jgi:hypothetical protein